MTTYINYDFINYMSSESSASSFLHLIDDCHHLGLEWSYPEVDSVGFITRFGFDLGVVIEI